MIKSCCQNETEQITDRIAIVNGDSFQLLDSWPSTAALVADPPYGINYVYRGGGGQKPSLAGKGLSRKNMTRWRHAGEPIYGDDEPFDPNPFARFRWVLLWGADHFRAKLPKGGTLLAWDKTGDLLFNDTFCDAEFAWTNQTVKRNIVTHMWKGLIKTRIGEDNYGQPGANRPRIHPAQKPVALCMWCLRVLDLPPDTLVIDPFMGSGSIGVACIRTGLRYLGVEIDPKHYSTARERLTREAAQGLLMPTEISSRGVGR